MSAAEETPADTEESPRRPQFMQTITYRVPYAWQTTGDTHEFEDALIDALRNARRHMFAVAERAGYRVCWDTLAMGTIQLGPPDGVKTPCWEFRVEAMIDTRSEVWHAALEGGEPA